MLALDKILPSRQFPRRLETSRKYRQIRASLQEVGLIEPLSVTALDATSGQHLLLDGQLRWLSLTELNHDAAPCLVAVDDERYTYNNQVNRVPTIHEHFMICRAMERGVSAERLAKALNVNLSTITKKANLLEGLCPEAVEMMKERHFSDELSRVLRKMKPTRQVECVELMVSSNNTTVAYAEALLVATPANSLVDGRKPVKMGGVSPEHMLRMEREMANLQSQYRTVEQTYGEDVLNLVLARGYLSKLLGNAMVQKYLQQHQPEFFEQFTAIVATVSLDR
jgi:ParB-like chromosome segregation protein Spo0J